MKALLSFLGAALATLYAAAFVAAYVDYGGKAGQWFADFALLMLSLPFTWTMSQLTSGAFEMTGEDTLKLIIAALFCCGLAYVIGAALEWALRSAWRAATRSR